MLFRGLALRPPNPVSIRCTLITEDISFSSRHSPAVRECGHLPSLPTCPVNAHVQSRSSSYLPFLCPLLAPFDPLPHTASPLGKPHSSLPLPRVCFPSSPTNFSVISVFCFGVVVSCLTPVSLHDPIFGIDSRYHLVVRSRVIG